MLFLDNPFLQMALWAGLLSSLASGVIGSFVVVKRIAFIAGSISHSILGGMGLCLWLQRTHGIQWLDPMVGAFVSAIASSLLLGWIHLNYRQREDAVIAAIWSIGMGLGIIFLSITPGSNVDLLNFLFGNILWIQPRDLWLLLGLDAAVLAIIAIYYRRFLTLCFDEEQALLQGVAVRRLYLLLLALVAISVVLLIQIIGTILVLALLTIPATLAALFTKRLHTLMIAASASCALFNWVGLEISYILNWPPGATIALTAAAAYLIALPLKASWKSSLTSKTRFG